MSPRTIPLDPTIAALLAELGQPQVASIHALRAAVLGADPRIAEGIKWKAPSYHLAGAHFATFNLRRRDEVQLILHLGARPRPEAKLRASLGDPGLSLDWRSPDRAILTVRSAEEARRAAAPLRSIVRAWLGHL